MVGAIVVASNHEMFEKWKGDLYTDRIDRLTNPAHCFDRMLKVGESHFDIDLGKVLYIQTHTRVQARKKLPALTHSFDKKTTV